MRQATSVFDRQADLAHEPADTFAPFGGSAAPVHDQRLFNDASHRRARVQRCERILKDHLHLGPMRPQILPPERRDVGPVQFDRRRNREFRMRTASRASVDLPQPDSPTRPRTSPAAISRLTPSTACTMPRPVRKCLTTSVIRNSVFTRHPVANLRPASKRPRDVVEGFKSHVGLSARDPARNAQRGAKRQPAGSAASGGTIPGISVRGGGRPAASTSISGLGSELSKPRV